MTQYLANTIMKEYSNSPALLQLLAFSDQWIDATQFTADFLAKVWDISTAVNFGLDIWGRILGVGRYLQIAPPTAGNYFGWNINGAVGTSWKPWGQAPFYGGAASGTVSYALPDAYYRQLLLVKAAANIAKSDCQSINALMRAMFGSRGRCYIGYDIAHPMDIAYHFEFFPTPVEKAIIELGIFPQPAGTNARYVYATLTYVPFGFAGMNTGTNPKVVVGWSVPSSPFYMPQNAKPLP